MKPTLSFKITGTQSGSLLFIEQATLTPSGSFTHEEAADISAAHAQNIEKHLSYYPKPLFIVLSASVNQLKSTNVLNKLNEEFRTVELENTQKLWVQTFFDTSGTVLNLSETQEKLKQTGLTLLELKNGEYVRI